MSLISVAQARARGVALPADDEAAQAVIDEQEAWLARRIGPLTGPRTETFFVGAQVTAGKLGLRRITSDVDLTDGGVAVDADQFRLVDLGAAVVKVYDAGVRWWTGPYVVATYTPDDYALVEAALYNLCSLFSAPVTEYESEQIGAYSYRRGGAGSTRNRSAQRAVIADGILPKHDQLTTLLGPRRVRLEDPVINRAEPIDEA